MAVVAIPFTSIEGSPALKPSGPVDGQSPPSSSCIRRATASPVSGSAAERRRGTTPAVPAISAKRLRERYARFTLAPCSLKLTFCKRQEIRPVRVGRVSRAVLAEGQVAAQDSRLDWREHSGAQILFAQQ